MVVQCPVEVRRRTTGLGGYASPGLSVAPVSSCCGQVMRAGWSCTQHGTSPQLNDAPEMDPIPAAAGLAWVVALLGKQDAVDTGQASQGRPQSAGTAPPPSSTCIPCTAVPWPHLHLCGPPSVHSRPVRPGERLCWYTASFCSCTASGADSTAVMLAASQVENPFSPSAVLNAHIPCRLWCLMKGGSLRTARTQLCCNREAPMPACGSSSRPLWTTEPI